MKTNLIAALAVLFGAVGAHAQAAAPAMDSEYFHQAPAGINEVRPHINYFSATEKFTGGTADKKVYGIRDLGARYEYGLSEMLSVYGDLSFSMLKGESQDPNLVGGTVSSTSSGLDDIELGARGTWAMGMGSLRYGLGLNFGIENAKIDNAGNMTNNSSGGLSFMPYVGYDMAMGPGFLGARLSYNWMLDRKMETANGTTTIKNGHDLGLGVFYEYLMSDITLGAKVQYDWIANTTFENSGLSVGGENSSPFLLGVYTRVPVGPGVLLAGLDYVMFTGKKNAANQSNGQFDDDSRMAFNLNVGYRIAF